MLMLLQHAAATTGTMTTVDMLCIYNQSLTHLTVKAKLTRGGISLATRNKVFKGSNAYSALLLLPT